MASDIDPSACLSWGLVIATKDRLDALKTCVSLAVKQNPPPVEVVVADSSADWAQHAAIIQKIIMEHPAIRLVYEQGMAPSLTVQRNQAIARAEADIVFLIDDDSFMHPGCAARIMEAYEADTDRVLGGIQAMLSPDMPQDVQIVGARKVTGNNVAKGGANGARRNTAMARVTGWLKRKILLMHMEENFIPYRNSGFSKGDLPAPLAAFGLLPAALFHGCRMTFRREVIAAHGFDPLLLYYCPGEDVDASYRVSGSARLATCTRAHLHHYTASAGRIDRYKSTVLSGLNQAVLLKRYAQDPIKAKAAFMKLMWRRLVAEGLKDGLSRRVSFPQMRGINAIRKQSYHIFEMQPEELESWYHHEQERIVKGPSSKQA